MTEMLAAFGIVVVVLLAPIPFARTPRTRRALAILAWVVAALAILAWAATAERNQAANLALFFGLIATFWIAGRFEAK